MARALLRISVLLVVSSPAFAREDLRPQCVVGDYRLIVNELVLSASRSRSLWDLAQPWQVTNQLTVELLAEASRPQALIPLLGFDPGIRAVTDTGAVLAPDRTDLPLGTYHLIGSTLNGNLGVAFPPPGVASLASVEGDLVLYAEVETADFEFKPAEPEVTKQVGDIQLTWQREQSAHGSFRFGLAMPRLAPRWKESKGGPEVRMLATLTMADGHQEFGFAHERAEERPDDTGSFDMYVGFSHSLYGTPVSIACRTAVVRSPTKRLHYKFENLPLPTWPRAK
jgi:hypothetical protein